MQSKSACVENSTLCKHIKLSYRLYFNIYPTNNNFCNSWLIHCMPSLAILNLTYILYMYNYFLLVLHNISTAKKFPKCMVVSVCNLSLNTG